ncbi:hypothetical protein LTR08_005532 [Meristemomyces frigidus]|nr:hypothetical protein LTR08_005532 [Meristemomyces frigidus]
MSADVEAPGGHALQLPPAEIAATAEKRSNGAAGDEVPDEDDEEDDDDDDDDEEPKLKYAKLTGTVSGVYRSNDSTATFTVAGDKMVMGTHNGNIHVLSLPSLQVVRTYRAHSATITSVSVSPVPPAPSTVRTESGSTQVLSAPAPPSRTQSIQAQAANSPRTPRGQQQQQPATVVPNSPNNQLYIATSSLDGHVCVSSLVDSKDVLLRNFARPVQAVALSPDYKNDKNYLSGGLAGNLILTVGGKAGVSADANTNSAAAAASGWLGSIGLGANTGRDTVLHSGEGSISTIKWSLTGRWVVWVNEEGIKIMRSHLKLGPDETEDAWRRVAHAAKPNRKNWQDMAGVWKARAEWIEDKNLESDDPGIESATVPNGVLNGNGTVRSTASAKKAKKFEKLVVGWGDTAWILHVQAGIGYTAHSGQKQIGSADIVHKLQFRDCIVSGLSLYTPSLLAILAYRTRDDDDKPIEAVDAASKGRQRHRRTGLRPQLRLVNVRDGTEVDVDELPISRFETLSAQDYQLGTLYMPAPLPDKAVALQRGALEAAWEAAGGGYAQRLFTSSASVMSGSSSGRDERGTIRPSMTSPSPSIQGVSRAPTRKNADAHPNVIAPGLKLFIQSPYDCVLAIKRDLSDHLGYLIEHEHYAQAWTLIDENPDVIDSSTIADRQPYPSSQPSTPSQINQDSSLADFFGSSDSDSQTTATAANPSSAPSSAAAKEKRRIGDLWLQQLVAAEHWVQAGQIAGKVLGTSSRWEHWVWTFAQANKFDEITPYIPSTQLRPPLPSLVYEVVLGHYISVDRLRLKGLLETWDPELFDVRSVITALEARLQSGEVTEETSEEGVRGRDWRILMEALAKLYLASGRGRDALRCWIRCQNAEKAFEMIREEKLVDAVADDVPGLLMLRVTREQMASASLAELEESSNEAVQLLVEEAHRGTVSPDAVIRQLERKGLRFQPFLFFYLRALWRGPQTQDAEMAAIVPRRKFDRRVDEGHALVEDHADLAVTLFAEYDRELLMTFLRASSVYSYEAAAAICENRHFIPELVYILSKTGQTKRALFLIIGELGDVSQAIAFAKTVDNGRELWEDLLDYSMDKPRFIKGLLEEVGTSAYIDPVNIVRRIPEGLEIEGLREGISKLVREYEIQFSISEGVARVLRGEVGRGMETLRAGRKKAVRFEVVRDPEEDVELAVRDVPTNVPEGRGEGLPEGGKRRVEKAEKKTVEPGHCVGCGDPFSDGGKSAGSPVLANHASEGLTASPSAERDTLIGFACGHVYHLSCLLRANPTDPPSEEAIERVQEQLGRGDDDDQQQASYTSRSVGAKVAHAHVIKNVVKGGCRYCVVPEGA